MISLDAVSVIVQEEGQGGCGEAEVETEEDETLQVAELLLSEGVTAERQEVADPWGAHLHLWVDKVKGSQLEIQKTVLQAFSTPKDVPVCWPGGVL